MHFPRCTFLRDLQKEILFQLFKTVVMVMYLKKKKQIQILETASSEIKKESLNRSGLVPVSQYNAIMQSNVLYIFKRILKIV